MSLLVAANVLLVMQVLFYILFCDWQLTAKNIQCMRTLLALAQCHGELLTTAWYPILSTFQVFEM